MKQGPRDRLPVRRPTPIDDRGADAAVVDRILERLEPLPDSLSARPEFADALRARVLAQFHAQLADALPAEPGRARRSRLGRLAVAGSVALMTVSGAAGAVAASEGSLPGDPLYGLKRAVEQVELAMASTDRRDEVELALLGERIEELRLEAAAGDWPSVRGLCAEITATGGSILARGATLGGATGAMLAAIDDARSAAPASEQGHLQTFQIMAQQLAKRDGDGGGSGGPGASPAMPTTMPVASAEPSPAAKTDKGEPPDNAGGNGNQGNGNQGQGQGNEGQGNQGNQDQGQGNQGNGNQGQGQGNEENANPGQGQGNQGNQGQDQGNQGQGQGNGNQGNGNQGNGNQGQGQGNDKGPKDKEP